jgi:hypothetical protein
MRALSVAVVIAVASTLFVSAPKAQAQVKKPDGGVHKVGSSDFDLEKAMRLSHGKARARKSFSSPSQHRKPEEKMAGWCSIDCGDGGGTTVWAGDVGDCACQCSGYCGGGCFAWEVNGPNTAYCSVY